uniref:RRM domain-containing protein n=1 Tax=Clytia hemisphaerica TaxID=252671 RepID=A0A7M5XK25_9CNID
MSRCTCHTKHKHTKTLLKPEDVKTIIATPALDAQEPNNAATTASTSDHTISPLLSQSGLSLTATAPVSTTATNDGPKRLHVTNLPFKVRDTELRNIFALPITVLPHSRTIRTILQLYHRRFKCARHTQHKSNWSDPSCP